MKNQSKLTIAIVSASLAVLTGTTLAAQDRYSLQVPDGLAFSEFRGYEKWQIISVSLSGDVFAAILVNPVMADAYQAGVPGNGKPFPDGSKADCGHACHLAVKAKDFIFHPYQKR